MRPRAPRFGKYWRRLQPGAITIETPQEPHPTKEPPTMAVNYNKVIIAGNLTRDPQTRYLQNNRAVANFSLAVNRRWRDGQGQPQEETTFVEVEAWGTQAENVGKYMSKGRSCLVEGRLKLDSWNDKETGAKRSQLRVVADHVQFLPSSQQGGQPQQANGQSATPPQPPAGGANYYDDEPPF